METYNDINQARSIAKKILDNFKTTQKVQYSGLIFSAKISVDRIEIDIRNLANNLKTSLLLARHSQTKGTPEQVMAEIISDFTKLGVVKK